MATNKTFAERLIELREETGKKRQEVADNLEISRASLEYYEKGKRKPDIEVLVKIADYYKVSTDYLLGLSKHSTQDKNLSSIADYLGIDENTCKIMHNKVFEEHTRQFIKYLFENEKLFNEMDFYFSSVVLGRLQSHFYKHLPVKPQYKFVNESSLVKKIALSSVLDILPTARHKFLLSIKDREDITEQIAFEIMKDYVDLSILQRDVKFYLENPDFIPDRVLNAANVTDNEFMLDEFEDLISEEQAIEEYKQIVEFKIDFYNRLLAARGGSDNGDNP